MLKDAPDYQPLRSVLDEAFAQASTGKGSDRHAGGRDFENQPILEIARMLDGVAGHAFQIMKKAQEANRLSSGGQSEAAVREFLGAINYSAAAILLIRERSTEKVVTISAEEPTKRRGPTFEDIKRQVEELGELPKRVPRHTREAAPIDGDGYVVPRTENPIGPAITD